MQTSGRSVCAASSSIYFIMFIFETSLLAELRLGQRADIIGAAIIKVDNGIAMKYYCYLSADLHSCSVVFCE